MHPARPVPGALRLALAVLACCVLALCLPACGDDDGGKGGGGKQLQDFVPPGTATLPTDGPLETYATIAELATSVIDGDNAQYDHGFVEAVFQSYLGAAGSLAGASAMVQITEHADETNAGIIFDNIHDVGTWNLLGGFDGDVFEGPGFGTYTLLFQRGVYVAKLTISEYGAATDDAKTALQSFATHILVEMGD